MTTNNSTEPLKEGTFVKIRNSRFGRVQIVEYRGNLGPKGARVYRIRVRKKPKPAFIEVLEEQLEVVGAQE